MPWPHLQFSWEDVVDSSSAQLWAKVTDEVVAVMGALQEEGYLLEDMAIYGASAGGGLAAATVLRMREQGKGTTVAVVMWSPWTDVTIVGDTWVTLLN